MVAKSINVVLYGGAGFYLHEVIDDLLAWRIGRLKVRHMLRGLNRWAVAISGFVGNGQAHRGVMGGQAPTLYRASPL